MPATPEGDYLFQSDWFTRYVPLWEKQLAPFKDQPQLNFLEVGSFEGKSTIWTLVNILTEPTSRMVCVDTFEGSDEHEGMGIDCTDIESRFRHNLKVAKVEHKVEIIKGKSQTILKKLPENHFDFAYIDGSHYAADVLFDAVIAFTLVNKGGIIAFDDYYWDMVPNRLHRPKIAINAFLEVFQERLAVQHKGEQVFVKKL